ncbi:hypothetical protein HYALB_00009185 [Hymenoscyphus albidus]|uniref:Uncharacterized protein n=1 Tax=Hymenoscyphus albidus TaxID=595503 RepID=A0A9N9LLD8_9HELO|nr:hypothetical protein HYALB_00009185 [Hymenoscyphus albidus]
MSDLPRRSSGGKKGWKALTDSFRKKSASDLKTVDDIPVAPQMGSRPTSNEREFYESIDREMMQTPPQGFNRHVDQFQVAPSQVMEPFPAFQQVNLQATAPQRQQLNHGPANTNRVALTRGQELSLAYGRANINRVVLTRGQELSLAYGRANINQSVAPQQEPDPTYGSVAVNQAAAPQSQELTPAFGTTQSQGQQLRPVSGELDRNWTFGQVQQPNQARPAMGQVPRPRGHDRNVHHTHRRGSAHRHRGHERNMHHPVAAAMNLGFGPAAPPPAQAFGPIPGAAPVETLAEVAAATPVPASNPVPGADVAKKKANRDNDNAKGFSLELLAGFRPDGDSEEESSEEDVNGLFPAGKKVWYREPSSGLDHLAKIISHSRNGRGVVYKIQLMITGEYKRAWARDLSRQRRGSEGDKGIGGGNGGGPAGQTM